MNAKQQVSFGERIFYFVIRFSSNNSVSTSRFINTVLAMVKPFLQAKKRWYKLLLTITFSFVPIYMFYNSMAVFIWAFQWVNNWSHSIGVGINSETIIIICESNFNSAQIGLSNVMFYYV